MRTYSKIVSLFLILSSAWSANNNTKIDEIVKSIAVSKDEQMKSDKIFELAQALRDSKEENKEAMQLLDEILNDEKENNQTKESVAYCLGVTRKKGALASINKYIQNSKNKKNVNGENIVYIQIVNSLGKFDKEALPILMDLYKDESIVKIVSESTFVSIIGSTGGTDVLDFLIEKLKSDSIAVRRSAVYGLSTIKGAAENIQDKLSKQALVALNDNDGQVRELAVEMLGKKMNTETYQLMLQISEKDSYSREEIKKISGKEEKVVRYPVREKALKNITEYERVQSENMQLSSSIEIQEKEYDLGTIKEGSEAKLILKVKNTGKNILNINSISSNKNIEIKCDFSKCKKLKENAEGEITIAFLPLQKIEKQEYVIKIGSNDKNNPKANIKVMLSVVKDVK